jgi:PKHD-type hydroxylase
MELRNNYFVLEDAVTQKFCAHVLEYGKRLKESIGVTYGYNDPNNLTPLQKKELEKLRKSKVVWMDEKWIYRELQPVIREVNTNAGWDFQWQITEPIQFTKYEGSKKQHYDWHTDSGTSPDPDGLIRKISASLVLVDSDEYEGGDFQICVANPNQNKIINIQLKNKGTMIFFPSFVWHRVMPVTKGTRYSLVCWNKGLKFN